MKRNAILAFCAVIMAISTYAMSNVKPATAQIIEVEISTPAEPEEFIFEAGNCGELTYINDTIDLVFALPDGWYFTNIDSLKMTTSSITSTAENGHTNTFYEFYACDSVGKIESFIFVVEDMLEHDGDGIITETMFLDTLSEQYLAVESVDYAIGESYEKEVAGMEMLVLPTKVAELGISQRNYVHRIGHYMISFTATAFTDDALDAIEATLSQNLLEEVA